MRRELLVDLPETEDQVAARLRAVRCRDALKEAPELVRHIRALVEAGERTEAGVWSPPQRTPLVTEWVDDADEVFVRLLEWVRYWSEQLSVEAPSAVKVHWSRVDQDSRAAAPERAPLGFRGGTTPEGAADLVGVVGVWLNLRAERISGHKSGQEYQDDVAKIIRDLQGKYRLTPARDRRVQPRVCPECSEAGVGVSWPGPDIVKDVLVSCEVCNVVLPAPTAREIEFWLGESARVPVMSEACAGGEHELCVSVNCRCPHHLGRSEGSK